MLDLGKLTGLGIYPASIAEAGGVTYFLGRRGAEKLVGSVGDSGIVGAAVATDGTRPIIVGPTSPVNAGVIRNVLPWTAPKCLALATSAGLGDRLGLATPGHIRAVRKTHLAPIFAQQSIREMTRTQRTPAQVMDAATWGVLQEGFRSGFGSDADHLQKPEDIDSTAAAGFTMFTIDPGAFVENSADRLDGAGLTRKLPAIDFETLAASQADLFSRYVGKTLPIQGKAKARFTEETFLRALVKYGSAIAHTVRMFRHLQEVHRRPFEVEVSVDETETPTSPAEHCFFAAELKRLGVTWVSMAPRFVGRFEKGVDYIGDLRAFRASLAQHVAVMKALGPYKISIHSGSDKFRIYPIVAELTGGLVHLKTAGTSYLEALRAIAGTDPGLFREILDFARGRYETDKASYHVSARVAKVPPAASLKDRDLPALLDDFDARQVLHCTFGSVLTADGGQRFRTRLYAALEGDEETYYDVLQKHLGRHLAPFA